MKLGISRRSRAERGKKCTKSVITCKVVVLLIKTIVFMKFSLPSPSPSPSPDLNVPIKLLARAYVLYLYYELLLSFFLVLPISHICLGT